MLCAYRLTFRIWRQICWHYLDMLREAAKKEVVFLMAVPLRGRGGGGFARKRDFIWDFFVEKVPTAIKLEEGGGVRLYWHYIKKTTDFKRLSCKKYFFSSHISAQTHRLTRERIFQILYILKWLNAWPCFISHFLVLKTSVADCRFS